MACLEEIAYRMNYINRDQLLELAEPLKKNDYGQYLIDIANESKKSLGVWKGFSYE